MDKEGAILFLTFLLALTLYPETTSAETKSFLVGGLNGWTKESNGNWFPTGTIFYAGDSLEFVYNQTDYNVVVVAKHAYETCKAPEGVFEYNSGDDEINIHLYYVMGAGNDKHGNYHCFELLECHEYVSINHQKCVVLGDLKIVNLF
nr:basic blue protein [Quercus suber]